MQDDDGWLLFGQPRRIITAVSAPQVLPALRAVETAVNTERWYAAGFLTYEASAAFDLTVHPAPGALPLLWFGLFDAPERLAQLPPATSSDFSISEWQPAISQPVYQQAIDQIKAQIAQGYTYQVNYTFPLQATFSGEPRRFFDQLVAAQQGQFAAYLDLGDRVICSVSPELFFEKNGRLLRSRPMKGTAVRGRTLLEDQQRMSELRLSEKNRAENVMIVDMIRNDMGRVADLGSVRVPHLFDIERYPTVLQMTSTVEAETDIGLTELMQNMFPCASITGAPKVRTMQIIRQLEPAPRGIYTGSIGFVSPDGRMRFNVAIRTVQFDRRTSQASYGVGGGIVWDSDAAAEYAECRLKAQVLTEKRPSFELLESLLWRPDSGFWLLAEHLDRLTRSADYFGFAITPAAWRAALETAVSGQTEPLKVRLTVDAAGKTAVMLEPLSQRAVDRPTLRLAAQPISTENVWLYHKTTNRTVYTTRQQPDADETIFWNERGELTETTYSNLVLLLDGELVTPPIESGLLGGTFREWLLRHPAGHENPHGLAVRERLLLLPDLDRCDGIFLINSVRGWRRGHLRYR